MVELLVPRPAATVLTLRDGDRGYEILMLRRNIRSDFVGGANVFPGGGVDDDDHDYADLVVGLDDVAASRRLDLAQGGLAFYVASLRELFEEAGLLVVCQPDGGAVNFGDEQRQRLNERRREVNAGTLTFRELLGDEGLALDLRGLEYVAHWVTPAGPPRRYDTRFFVVRTPWRQVATNDDDETVADTWLRPRDALAAHAEGNFEMMVPTVRNLEAIADFESADAVLAYARSREHIPRVEPQIVERDGAIAILTPGDEGFQS